MINNKTERLFKIFGENIKQKRIEKDITIEELSKLTKINEKYLIRIEKGAAKGLTVTHIYAIAKGLKIKPRELCEGI